MSEVVLSELTIELIPGPSRGGRSSPPASVSQIGPMTIGEAKARSSFPVVVPTAFPEGFRAVDALMLSGDFQMTLLAYEAATGRLTHVQAPIDQYKAGADGRRRYFVVGQSIVESQVGALPAALASIPPMAVNQPGSYNLVWEHNGVLNQLLGHGVGVADLLAIASSVV